MNSTAVGVKVPLRTSTRPAPKIGVAFAAIPLDVLKDRGVSPAARLAFAALANHARMKRGEVSTLTNRKLAEAAGLSVGTARRALDELEAAGLVRRLFGPSKRIRLAVAITYQGREEGCAPPAPPSPGVAQAARRGCAPAGPEVAQAGAGDLLRAQEEDPKSPPLARQGGEESPPDGVAAADYLRRCVAAARLGLAMPEPPSGVAAAKGPQIVPPPSPAPTHNVGTSPPAPRPSQDATRRAIGEMVGRLGESLSLAELRPARKRR